MTPGNRIAVCAPEETLQPRIEEILTLAGHEIVEVSSSVDDLLTSAPQASPELVVLGWKFEPFTASAEIRRLRAGLGGVPLVIVASGPVGQPARKLVISQAEGMVRETELESALAATVDGALAGQLCLPAALGEHLAQPVLSYREKQVLELVLAGLTNGDIADRLYLSESTVKSHLASSFRKLGVSSRTQAARRMLDPNLGVDVNRQPLLVGSA